METASTLTMLISSEAAGFSNDVFQFSSTERISSPIPPALTDIPTIRTLAIPAEMRPPIRNERDRPIGTICIASGMPKVGLTNRTRGADDSRTRPAASCNERIADCDPEHCGLPDDEVSPTTGRQKHGGSRQHHRSGRAIPTGGPERPPAEYNDTQNAEDAEENGGRDER